MTSQEPVRSLRLAVGSPPGPADMRGPAGPGEATWTHRFHGGEAWSVPGGMVGVDFAAVPSSVESIEGTGPYLLVTSPRMVSDVQAWVLAPQSNSGRAPLSLSEDVRYTARRFASREGASLAPILTVSYNPVPEGDVWLLAGLAGLVWLVRARHLGRRWGSPGRIGRIES